MLRSRAPGWIAKAVTVPVAGCSLPGRPGGLPKTHTLVASPSRCTLAPETNSRGSSVVLWGMSSKS